MIQSYLNDAEKKFITQDAVKTWLKELEVVAFDADNVLDELNYHLLHNKVDKMKKLKDKVLSCFPSFHHIKMAHSIKQINLNFESINKRATELRLESIVVNAPAPDVALETDSFTLDPIFTGRDRDVAELVELLTETPEERMFTILSILGMGGLGKTTLTRKLLNHQKIKAQFGLHIWVHVSRNFDPMILFKKILSNLTSQAEQVESREVVLKKLQEALKAKPYVLVLDDVWNQDHHKWEDFINSLSGVTSIKGNGIIITTRNTEVASIVKPLHIHCLNGLSDEDCWLIIKRKAFEKGDVTSGFETIGGNIGKRCQGLPLAANVVGGVLWHKSEDEWLSIQQNWLSDVDGDNISKILKLSFDNLSLPSLKKCFSYCSIFPKGERILKQELIELWMAEGFLQSDEGKNDMECVGSKILNVLLQNSLMQVIERDDYGDVESCVMHDLVHDLACSVLGSSKVGHNNADGISLVRYITHEHRRDESSPIPKEAAKYLRTLFLKGAILDAKFSSFKCLHVFTLTSYQVEELPSSIRKLIHLRNLNISKTGIKYLPDSIGELHHLQTLRANTGYMKKLPITLKYLINLRHLYIGRSVELPPEIGRLICLQTLTHFRVGNKNGSKIEELGSLKNLKGKLEIRNLENVHDKEEAEKANIFQKPNLFKLRFEWDRPRKGENDESVLEGLQPHPNLKKLEINGFRGKRFPLWTLKMAVRDEPLGSWVGFNKLMEIRLSGCEECEEIPTLGNLPNLKSLYLEGLRNVKSINSSFYGVCQEPTIVFPALERLTLSGMHELRVWRDVESGANCEVKVFPHLQYLKINECKQLTSAPSYFSACLTQLEITTMENYKHLENICGIKLTSLTNLCIKGLDRLETLPDWLFYSNQNLSELKISRCSKLIELPNGLHTLNSLEELIIEDCPNLKSIAYPNGRGSLTSLRSLEIHECPEVTNLPLEMVSAPSLDTVSLVELRSLKNLPSVIDCLAKPPHLRELKILGVPNVMPSFGIAIWHFRSLRKLVMDVAVKEIVDGMLQGCCESLDWLDLKGMETWECLPESMQHLTCVSWLSLHNFGIEELPEWFGCLSSLERLYLFNCQKLRRLASVDAMQRLTKLQALSIRHCPELGIDVSDWPKISHVPVVWVDDRLIRSRS